MKIHIASLGMVSISIFTLQCTPKGKREIHLIPNHYIGKVIVDFDDSSRGIPDSLDYRLYDIPMNGVLRTILPPNDGFLADGERSFFYKNGNERIHIPFMQSYDQSLVTKSPNKVYVFNLQVGRDNKIPVLTYCIDSLKNALSYYEEGVKRW